MAEGVFRHLSAERGVASLFEVASAGTVGYQTGSCPDSRAVRAAGRHGIDISSKRAQSIHDLDLCGFDRVFTMDFENYNDVFAVLSECSGGQVHMMTDFADTDQGTEIEDPYYGSEEGFDNVMNKLVLSANGILSAMQAEYGLVSSAAAESAGPGGGWCL
jgi:protein-tyrosine phosphatase